MTTGKQMPRDMEKFCAFGRKLKERALAEDLCDGNLATAVLFERDGEVQGGGMSQDANKYHGLSLAARFASVCADRVAFINDGFQRIEAADDPSAFRSGSMQEAWEAGQREGITEVLILLRCDRNLEVFMVTLPYATEGKSVRWHEPVVGGITGGGFLPDELRKIMAAPTLLDHPHFVAGAKRLGVTDRKEQLDRATQVLMTDVLPQAGFIPVLWAELA